MGRNITIVDIAKESGVSISTVSRVLTGNAKVNPEKKHRVQEVIDKYHFKPNALARGLIQTKTNVIGIITADIRNPYYSSVFVACERAASAEGYHIILANSFGDRLNEFSMIENFFAQKVDAVIILGGAPDDIALDKEFAEKVEKINESIPVLVSGNLVGTSCKRINVDMEKGIRLVIEHISTIPSIKKIALIGGSTKVGSTIAMRKSFKEQLNYYRLSYFPELDIPNDRYDEIGGYVTMSKIFDSKNIPDALVCVNDFTAVGAVRAIKEHGLRIPEDISVISFDDTYIAELCSPQLTSVSYNYTNYGATIIETAIKLINGEQIADETLITPKLRIRSSCKRIAEGR